MRLISISLVLLISFGSFAANNDSLRLSNVESQVKGFSLEVRELKAKNLQLERQLSSVSEQLKFAKDSLILLNKKNNQNSDAIASAEKKLGLKLSDAEQKATEGITAVNQSISRTTWYIIIGVLIALLVSGLVFMLLRKKQKEDKTDLISQLSQTKLSIEESLIKQFGKQTELMETQLQLIVQQKNAPQPVENAEPDHSLALKVASEINLIERNISLMDTGTKGLKQLAKSVGKLKDNLAANGYELPELLGKPFNQGMKVIIASSVPDENLEKGKEIITKVIIPQVNYNGKMIQSAQIEVSVGV